MIKIHASRRGWKMSRTALKSTRRTPIVFDAPDGVSLKKSNGRKLTRIIAAEIMKTTRQRTTEFAAPSASGRKFPERKTTGM